MTHLCVAILVDDAAIAKRDVALAAEAGADMVELRIDRVTDEDLVRDVVAASTIPAIVTYRPTWEGGECDLPDAERLPFLMRAAEDAAYVDIELAAKWKDWTLATLPRDSRPGLIVSSHDFRGRPDRLYNLLTEMTASPGDVNKIVWTARSIRDNLEAFEILRQKQKPTIALCMGEAGLISRILAKKFGAFLTFASLETGKGTAPGQVSIADMKRLYRWDSINPDTRVYGVVASPVMHSMSPAIHNASFEHVGFDGVYLPLLVEGSYESFKAFMETFLHAPGLHLSGLSVTLPHKENALRYLQEKGAEIEPLATSIGAVNTIVIDRDDPASLAAGNSQLAIPKLRGLNSDYAAILDSITSALNITRDGLKDLRIAVLGAGGTGRTAVAALAACGATVVVYNRTRDKADALAAEFTGRTGKVVSAPTDKLCDSCCHVYVNTTTVGMYPNVDASPFGDAPPKLTGDSLVFDTIYNPLETKLLAHARSAGAKTIPGIEMFVRQAARQFESWTGKPAPTDLMHQVVEQRLRRP